VEISIPANVTGDTFPEEDGGHVHKFSVTYNNQGQFMGGKTDKVQKHYHPITRGTATDDADGHSHRFSHVENITIKET
jgi:hypothetical protein